MNRAGTIIALAALIALTSCSPVFSLHPFYTEKDIVFEPDLLGTWFDPSDKDDRSVIEFKRLRDNAYTIKIMDRSMEPCELDTFEAHLVKIDGHLFLDATQSNIKDLALFVIPGHMIGRITLRGDALSMSFLDDDWTQNALSAGTISIRHEDLENGTPVLTATTPELQKFILDHVDDNKAFAVSGAELHRKK